MAATELSTLTQEQMDQYNREGMLLVKRLFSAAEMDAMQETFEKMSCETIPGYFEPDLHGADEDPLKRYPRVMHPHRFNDLAMRYMLHKPVMDILADLYGEEAYAAQSMYYYKPPGSRGLALHQDNFYLQVAPGNCIAAWTAVDDVDEENGGLLVVPKTADYPIVCPDQADKKETWGTHVIKPPKDRGIVPAVMKRGDVLFFNGNLIHGSYRNKSKTRYRRSFVCHYANASATKINGYYRPLWRADGTPVEHFEENEDGGPCGVQWSKAVYH